MIERSTFPRFQISSLYLSFLIEMKMRNWLADTYNGIKNHYKNLYSISNHQHSTLPILQFFFSPLPLIITCRWFDSNSKIWFSFTNKINFQATILRDKERKLQTFWQSFKPSELKTDDWWMNSSFNLWSWLCVCGKGYCFDSCKCKHVIRLIVLDIKCFHQHFHVLFSFFSYSCC